MATTTFFGWETPDDTDLVKDGAAAIRTLGSSIDTTTKALNPSTTLGDIEYRSATANTNTRLALGTAGQVLTVNSGATAPEWAAPAPAALTLITTLSPSAVTEVTADNVFTSTYENYVIEIALDQSANSVLFAQLRSSAANLTSATYTYDTVGAAAATGQTSWEISANTGGACTLVSSLTLFRPQLASATFGIALRMADVDNSAQAYGYTNSSAAAYDGIRIAGTSGNITGKIRIYGLAN